MRTAEIVGAETRLAVQELANAIQVMVLLIDSMAIEDAHCPTLHADLRATVERLTKAVRDLSVGLAGNDAARHCGIDRARI